MGPEDIQLSMTATDILEYSFCPRFTYFERFLEIPEHQGKRFKVQKGREVHEQKQGVNRGYLRRTIGCVGREIGVRLYGQEGRYAGELDEALYLNDGTMAPLDYKWAVWKGRVFPTHTLQLTFYATLIEETFGRPVERGFLVYVRSKNKLITQPIGEEERARLREAIEAISRIRCLGWYPPPTPHKRQCDDCCYRNICEKI